MKKILTFLFLFIVSTSYGQDGVKVGKNGAPQKATAIIVKSTIDESKIFSNIASILIDNAYDIKFSDINVGVIQTEPRNIKGGIGLKVYASVRGNTVRLTGKVFVGSSDEGQVGNYGMKGSPNIVAFDELMRISKIIPQSSVEYDFIRINQQ